MALFKKESPKSISFQAPKIGVLLSKAHSDLDELKNLRSRLVSLGIDNDALPSDAVLMAFCLMGDHSRGDLLADFKRHLPLFLSRGLLTSGNVEELSTPRLRLLLQTTSGLIEHSISLSQAFDAGIAAWQADNPLYDGPTIRCADQATAIWGQTLKIMVTVIGAERLLIRPDPIFGLQEAIVSVESAKTTATVSVACDDGRIVLAAMAASGEVSVHNIHLSVLEDLS